jgi:hypothetical protein
MKAEEFQRVGDRVFFWEAYDPAVKTNLSCCAVQAEEVLVFIDPIPLAREAMEELLEFGTPAAVVVTNGNHLRASEEYRQKFGIPLLAHADAVPELGVQPDRLLAANELTPGRLMVHEIAGAAPGEIALHHPRTGLHFGDALVNVEPYGFAPLPKKYCRDYDAMAQSLVAFGALRFEVITFAHGTPVVSRAQERLLQVLAEMP